MSRFAYQRSQWTRCIGTAETAIGLLRRGLLNARYYQQRRHDQIDSPHAAVLLDIDPIVERMSPATASSGIQCERGNAKTVRDVRVRAADTVGGRHSEFLGCCGRELHD